MRWKKYMPYLVFILISLAAGGLSAIAVMRGLPAYERLAKPPLTPPSAAFPVVWGILYILMGAGAARGWRARGRGRGAALALYGLQLALNLLWSVWFFALGLRLFAFVWLLALAAAVALMIRAYYKINRPAAWLQVPYLAWSVFAAYLNLGVWLLNR